MVGTSFQFDKQHSCSVSGYVSCVIHSSTCISESYHGGDDEDDYCDDNKWFVEGSSYLVRSSLDPMLNVA